MRFAFLAIVSLILLFGCTSTQGSESNGKLKVVVTAYFLEDFIKGVGKDKVQVENLLPDGANPHSFEPSPRDIQRAYSADIFIFNGAGLEPYAQQLSQSLPDSVLVLEASKGLSLLEASDKDHGYFDPHVWLDPLLAKEQVEKIRDALSKKDPANAEYYKLNAQAYIKRLDDLDSYLLEQTSKFKKKSYIGFHPSFTYFNKRYGLSYAGVIEEFAGDEPSAQEMANIVQVTRENNIRAVFSEPFLDSRSANAIAKEINGKVLVLNPLHTLTPEDRAKGKDYFSVMNDNVEALGEVLN
jgi:zinc transport system substrate-binding protein